MVLTENNYNEFKHYIDKQWKLCIRFIAYNSYLCMHTCNWHTQQPNRWYFVVVVDIDDIIVSLKDRNRTILKPKKRNSDTNTHVYNWYRQHKRKRKRICRKCFLWVPAKMDDVRNCWLKFSDLKRKPFENTKIEWLAWKSSFKYMYMLQNVHEWKLLNKIHLFYFEVTFF